MLYKFNLMLAVLFCLTLVVQGFGQDVIKTVPQLKLNAPIEGSFAAGKTQTFALHLESNQFASLVLSQKGINAGIALENADDDQRLVEVNVNDGDYGYERALLASGDAPRDILVRVFPIQQQSGMNGEFSVALVELKSADKKNRLRIKAQTSLLNAVKLFLTLKVIQIAGLFTAQ